MSELPDITHGADDIVLPFQIDALDVRGRTARLGPAMSAIIARHAYPAPVARLLAEAVTLASLLASTMKFDGRLILQTQADGPVRMVVADIATPDRIRALARFDADRVAAAIAAGEASPAALLGRGTLVMTIDQGSHTQRYQGIVALEGQGLEAAASEYFLRSEQIPTRVRLAAAEIITPGADGPVTTWRAGGIMVQHLPKAGRQPDLPPGDLPQGYAAPEIAEADHWVEARAIVDTVGDDELVDPTLSPERLLFRLFHERGVRVFETLAVRDHCTCSREKVDTLIRSFTPAERRDMVENGAITVTCEYCSTSYRFEPSDFDPPDASPAP